MSEDRYVDCSSNNGIPNVAAYAAAGHAKLSVKVSEGTGYHWYEGDAVIRAAHAHGLTVQGYHWLRPDSDPRAQADYFAGWVEKWFRAGDDTMNDVERTFGVSDPGDARRADQVATFQERAAALLGTAPCIYTGNWYLALFGEHLQAEVRRWGVVMSDYSGQPLPNPYGLHYIAHQFTRTARVAGFPGPVDYNRILAAPAADTTGVPTMFAYRVDHDFYVVQDGARVLPVASDYARNVAATVGRPVAVYTKAMHERVVANQDSAVRGGGLRPSKRG